MFGGVAGYRPRVRTAYYMRVYVHSPEGHDKYRATARGFEGVIVHHPKNAVCCRDGGE
jgi:hypothetical protein